MWIKANDSDWANHISEDRINNRNSWSICVADGVGVGGCLLIFMIMWYDKMKPWHCVNDTVWIHRLGILCISYFSWPLLLINSLLYSYGYRLCLHLYNKKRKKKNKKKKMSFQILYKYHDDTDIRNSLAGLGVKNLNTVRSNRRMYSKVECSSVFLCCLPSLKQHTDWRGRKQIDKTRAN